MSSSKQSKRNNQKDYQVQRDSRKAKHLIMQRIQRREQRLAHVLDKEEK